MTGVLEPFPNNIVNQHQHQHCNIYFESSRLILSLVTSCIFWLCQSYFQRERQQRCLLIDWWTNEKILDWTQVAFIGSDRSSFRCTAPLLTMNRILLFHSAQRQSVPLSCNQVPMQLNKTQHNLHNSMCNIALCALLDCVESNSSNTIQSRQLHVTMQLI